MSYGGSDYNSLRQEILYRVRTEGVDALDTLVRRDRDIRDAMGLLRQEMERGGSVTQQQVRYYNDLAKAAEFLARQIKELQAARAGAADVDREWAALQEKLLEMERRDHEAKAQAAADLNVATRAAREKADADRGRARAAEAVARSERSLGEALEGLAVVEQQQSRARGTLVPLTEREVRANAAVRTSAIDAAQAYHSFGLTVLFASQAIEDAQYGFSAVINNLGLIAFSVAPALKISQQGAAALAGGITLLGVAANQAHRHMDSLTAAITPYNHIIDTAARQTRQLEGRIKALADVTSPTVAQINELRAATERLAAAEADREANEQRTGREEATARAYQAALSDVGGKQILSIAQKIAESEYTADPIRVLKELRDRGAFGVGGDIPTILQGDLSALRGNESDPVVRRIITSFFAQATARLRGEMVAGFKRGDEGVVGRFFDEADRLGIYQEFAGPAIPGRETEAMTPIQRFREGLPDAVRRREIQRESVRRQQQAAEKAEREREQKEEFDEQVRREDNEVNRRENERLRREAKKAADERAKQVNEISRRLDDPELQRNAQISILQGLQRGTGEAALTNQLLGTRSMQAALARANVPAGMAAEVGRAFLERQMAEARRAMQAGPAANTPAQAAAHGMVDMLDEADREAGREAARQQREMQGAMQGQLAGQFQGMGGVTPQQAQRLAQLTQRNIGMFGYAINIMQAMDMAIRQLQAEQMKAARRLGNLGAAQGRDQTQTMPGNTGFQP